MSRYLKQKNTLSSISTCFPCFTARKKQIKTSGYCTTVATLPKQLHYSNNLLKKGKELRKSVKRTAEIMKRVLEGKKKLHNVSRFFKNLEKNEMFKVSWSLFSYETMSAKCRLHFVNYTLNSKLGKKYRMHPHLFESPFAPSPLYPTSTPLPLSAYTL